MQILNTLKIIKLKKEHMLELIKIFQKYYMLEAQLNLNFIQELNNI